MPLPKFAKMRAISMPHVLQRLPAVQHLRRKSQTDVSARQTSPEAANGNSSTSSPHEGSPLSSNLSTPGADHLSPDMLRLHRLTVALGEDFVIPDYLLSSDENLSAPLTTSTTYSPATPNTADIPAASSPPRGNVWNVQNGTQMFSAASLALRELCTSSFNGSPAEEPVGGEVLLGDCRVNENGTRFSEDIEREAEDLFNNTPTRITFSHDTVFQRGSRRAPVRPPTPPVVRPPTPPNTSRSAAMGTDLAESWEIRGTRAVISSWTEDFLQFREDFESGLQVYFPRWLERFFFRGARKLLRAVRDVAKGLEKLTQQLGVLPEDVAGDLSELEDQLRLCLQEARRVHSLMTREGNSANGPLTGSELAWRKYSIKSDLGPIMEHVAGNLVRARDGAKEIRRKLQEELEAVMPEVVAGVELAR